jgi:phytol kinase
VIAPWLGIALVCLAMGAIFCALKLAERTLHPHPELIRKLLHVCMGLTVLTFPWVFRERWPVVLLAGGSAAILAAMKFVPRLRDGIGTVLNAVHRPSIGEICFPISVAALILLSRGDKVLYVVPILILALADAVAALIGIAYGKVRYVTSAGFKSAEGSIAFLAIAFLSVHVPLLLCTAVPRPQTLLIAALIAMLSMLVEAIAARGLDNLLIPLGTFAFLRLYEHSTVHALVFRLVMVSLLVIFVLAWRRRSTLDDSALIAAALFGYGAAMLGGARWLIGPLVLFLLHVAMWPRAGQRRPHTVYAVASVTLAGFAWLILQTTYGGTIRFFFPYAVGFGAHLAIIGISRIAVDPSLRPRSARLAGSIAAGWMLALAQMLPMLLQTIRAAGTQTPAIPMLGALAGVALAALPFYALLPFLYGPRASLAAIHLAGFACALAGSILAAAVLQLVL